MDFIGFTYNGYHSIRDLNIYRTSDGSRYNENLTATMTDKTADVPGGDGQYYFGTQFKNRTFNVSYAFDALSESGLAKLKEVFRGDGIHELIFDETPYKVWSAKVTGTASIKHLCFEENGERVYKGEGSITFTCYYPYAHTPTWVWTVDSDGNYSKAEADGRLASSYSEQAYPNKSEWLEASRLTDELIIGANPGDIPAPFVLKLNVIQFLLGDNERVIEVGDNKITITTLVPSDKNYIQYNNFVWDSKTGIIKAEDTLENKVYLSYTGDSVCSIPVEPENTTIVYPETYIKFDKEQTAIGPEPVTMTLEYQYWYL